MIFFGDPESEGNRKGRNKLCKNGHKETMQKATMKTLSKKFMKKILTFLSLLAIK